MSHQRSITELDTPTVPEGDGGFRGVNNRLDPGQLDEGWLSDAVNVRCVNGRAATRKGIRKMSFATPASSYGYTAPHIIPFGTVLAAEVYRDPITDAEWLLVATPTAVYRTRPGVTGLLVPLPSGTTLAAPVQMIQTYSGMVMLRGAGADPLYLTDVAVGWSAIPAAGTPGNVALPRSGNGTYFQNRLFVVDGRSGAQYKDGIWVSDFGTVFNAIEGNAAYNSFKINQGSSDTLVALYKFNETTLIAGKTGSIYAVSGVYGTNAELALNARLDLVTQEYGVRAARSFVSVGTDVWFLAHRRGIVSLRQTEQNKLQGVDVPVSNDIQAWIQRINWEHAGSALAAYWDNKVYFAVPLDDSTTNNAVLVYDTQQQAWAGRDESAALTDVRAWVRFTYGGAQRLAYLDGAGYLNLYEDGYHDHTAAGTGSITYAQIATTIQTRGFGGRQPGNKRFGTVDVRLLTADASVTTSLVVPGVGETRTARAALAGDRTRYRRPYTRRFTVSGADGDFADPYREDYSIYPEDNILPNGGIVPGLLADSEVRASVRAIGMWGAVRVASTRGRVELAAATVGMQRGRARRGVEA